MDPDAAWGGEWGRSKDECIDVVVISMGRAVLGVNVWGVLL